MHNVKESFPGFTEKNARLNNNPLITYYKHFKLLTRIHTIQYLIFSRQGN